MNKKGFTLVELLGVITLLVLIGVLVIPSVNRIIKDNREKTARVNVDTILNAAYDYVQRHPNYLPPASDGAEGGTVIYRELVEEGLIKEEMINPNTDTIYAPESEIKITYYASIESVPGGTVPANSKFFGNYLFEFIEK